MRRSDDDAADVIARDAALVARIQRGDADAFDELVSPLLPRAIVLARRLMEHQEDADDLVQDACLRTLERLDQFDTRRAFAPWFFRVLMNLGLNAQQARLVRRHEAVSSHTVDESSGPDAHAESADVRERFGQAVRRLSPRQRQIVMLHDADGWSAAEIGESLTLSQPTVRWHLHEARRSLRAALSNLRDDAPRDPVEEA